MGLADETRMTEQARTKLPTDLSVFMSSLLVLKKNLLECGGLTPLFTSIE
jgi:hypothetical protein